MADAHVTAHALDVILKLEAEQLATALSSYFALPIPPIVRPFPTELPQLDLRTERLDNMFELADDSLLHMEYQSEYRSDLLTRFLAYDVAAYREHGRSIRTVVFYGPGISSAPSVLDIGSVRYEVYNIFLGRRDGEGAYLRLKERVARGEPLDETDRLELGLLPLMAHPRRTFNEMVTEALTLAQALPEGQQPQVAGTLLALAYHYVGKDAFDQLMEEFMATNLLETVLGRSLQQGLEQGMQQGMQQGIRQARRDDVLKVLASRFTSLPEALVGHIGAIDDLARLDALFDLALSAPTLDDVVQGLDTPRP